MSNAKFTYITRLMTTYNLEFDNEVLPDNLKCAKCSLALKDACAVPCGCKFCRACMDDLMASGSEFCPGVATDCRESLLSDFVTDYAANKSVSKLMVKCPQDGCLHQCQLAELEEHMRMCGRKSVACPFHELGCQEDKLVAEEMGEHFQRENLSHSEILIGMIADIKREINMLKSEIMLKDDQIKTMITQIGHVENENKSIKDELKIIKEKADLADRVQILSERIDREIDERRESDERDMVNVIEHVNREITAITAVIGLNKAEQDTAIRSVEDDIRSIEEDNSKWIIDDFASVKSRIQSIQTLVQIDASYDWVVDRDAAKTGWSTRTSPDFIGTVHPHRYRLAVSNMYSIDYGLEICLRVHPGESDDQLPWPFSRKVLITVADTSKCTAFQTITREVEIDRPPDKYFCSSDPFLFSHPSLTKTGLNLGRGMRVSCLVLC